jgi:hypothetical protein
MKRREIQLRVTERQVRFLWWLLSGTVGATDDRSVAKDCTNIQTRIECALERAGLSPSPHARVSRPA